MGAAPPPVSQQPNVSTHCPVFVSDSSSETAASSSTTAAALASPPGLLQPMAQMIQELKELTNLMSQQISGLMEEKGRRRQAETTEGEFDLIGPDTIENHMPPHDPVLAIGAVLDRCALLEEAVTTGFANTEQILDTLGAKIQTLTVELDRA